MVDLASLEGIASTAIPGEAPAGINARYEEAYEELSLELAKLESLSDDMPEWPRVAELSCTLLTDSSKDMMVAAWMAGALWETDQYAGLRAGLGALRVILRDYWEDGFPTRLRARRSAVAWICDRAISWSELADPLATREDLEDLVAIMGEMYSSTEDKWEGDDPPIWQLQKRYQALLDEMPAPPPEIEEAVVDEMPAPGDPGMAFAAPVAGAPQVQVGAISSRGEAFQALKQVALFIEKTEPHSPIVPLLRRAIEWSELSFQDLYTQLLGRFPTSMAYIWDTLGVPLDDVEGGVDSLPPESRGGHEESLAAPAVLPKAAPKPAANTTPAPSPSPTPAIEETPEPAGDDMPAPAAAEDDMPSPTIL